MAVSDLTVQATLTGSVRNIDIPDAAIKVICKRAEVDPETLWDNATEKQRDLSLAWLYLWLATSPSQSGGYSEEDADYKKSENGERMSKADKEYYRGLAKALFDKYGIEMIRSNKWGFVGHGFRYIRKRV